MSSRKNSIVGNSRFLRKVSGGSFLLIDGGGMFFVKGDSKKKGE